LYHDKISLHLGHVSQCGVYILYTTAMSLAMNTLGGRIQCFLGTQQPEQLDAYNIAECGGVLPSVYSQ